MSPSVQEILARHDSMAKNNSRRIVICLCVDSSFSMRTNLDKINEGVGNFLRNIAASNTMKYSTELSVVTFGNEVREICSFGRPEDAIKQIRDQGGLKADGSETKMGEGILFALEKLDEQLRSFSSVGTSYYKPWMIIISDGDATDPETVLSKAKKEIQDRLRNGLIQTKCLSMGEGSSTLAAFTEDGVVARLEELEVTDFFEALSRSVSEFSRCSLPPLHTEIWG